ncbi:FG-GAP repeat protein [Tahibacter amnicola]|uniref:FG-GAP repeat protein n=1 Tax=Tahibacter amnicola TaxID=2976241 RepID=A0ABY6BAD9_9GAMM|nr:FG-GAP repeat protein [Tahibacter amnicola]UXI67024.1 FG-GAP repeat protein [Tahibacter amnicola]
MKEARFVTDGVEADHFGGSIAISGDRLFVGAPRDGVDGSGFVFQRNGETWSPTATLKPDAIVRRRYLMFTAQIRR